MDRGNCMSHCACKQPGVGKEWAFYGEGRKELPSGRQTFDVNVGPLIINFVINTKKTCCNSITNTLWQTIKKLLAILRRHMKSIAKR